MADSQAAFNALIELARRSRESASGLPSQTQVQPHWSGVGFNLLDQYFVSPMGEISELLELPGYTKLPGVQPWVMGVANVRGRLLPLIDLAAFFGGQLGNQRKRQRVLVLEAEDIYTGLVVDAALGMQHFPVDSFSAELDEVTAEVQPFVNGSYKARHRGADSDDEQTWFVFNPARLTEDVAFINAAR